MEALTIQKGIIDAQSHQKELSDQLPKHAVGRLALAAGNASTELRRKEARHGYRQDSPPEVIGLLHQAQAGDTESFAALYRLHVGRIRRYVSARISDRDRSAIPDIVQDAFCEAFAGLDSAHHDVTGWLLAHAAKAYIRHARSYMKQERAVKRAREDVRRAYAYGHTWDERPVKSGETNASGTATVIGRLGLVRALTGLVPDQRRCIQHRYLEGQTQATTADLMGKTLKAVKSTEYRALVRLREGLAAPLQ